MVELLLRRTTATDLCMKSSRNAGLRSRAKMIRPLDWREGRLRVNERLRHKRSRSIIRIMQTSIFPHQPLVG
jgi:hypothetical protein